MKVNYTYWFPPGVKTPERLRKNTTTMPTAWSEIRVNPSRSDKDWRENTLWFWDWLRKTGDAHRLHAAVEYIAEDWAFKQQDFARASLFAVDTSFFLAQEITPPLNQGCLLCGADHVLSAAPHIDERTTIVWEAGFTNTGRFVVHVLVYEEMLAAGLSGFKVVPVSCVSPEDYVIILWRGSLEKVKRDLVAFPGELPQGIHIEEWGDSLVLTASPSLVEGPEFDELDNHLADLDEQDVLSYRFIPPTKCVGEIKTRWVGIDVTGQAGTELSVNEYVEDFRCPECAKGGLCPTEQLRVDCGTGDGSDVGVTESGRICLSRKAFDILCKPGRLTAEPVLCV